MRASTDKNIQGYNLFAELFPILSQPELTLQPQVLTVLKTQSDLSMLGRKRLTLHRPLRETSIRVTLIFS